MPQKPATGTCSRTDPATLTGASKTLFLFNINAKDKAIKLE